ncbi:MAG TPA: YceI family protein [Thermomicrobiales bacterium]|nr:YceI family protein [Thermomicrobiales bacterium]
MSTSVNEQAVGTTWAIDSAHSNVEFSVKHMMISTVKGQFGEVEGTVEWDGQNFETAQVEARIATQSITTFNETRDQHLRTNDFFNAEEFPYIHFKSTKIEVEDDDEFKIHGDLTIRDVTKPVVLDTEFEGMVEKDAFGKSRAAFTATTEINRKDFGVNWNQALEAGGFMVGDKVKVTLHIAIVR